MSFSEELKRQRKRLGISQKDFAEMFEIPQRTVENWETEERTPQIYVQKLLLEKLKGIERL